MKVIWLLVAISFVMCSKNKDEKPAPDLVKGLMAYYEFHQFNYHDSTGNLPALTSSGNLNWSLDRHSFISALNFSGGKVTVPVPNWKAYPITISIWVFFWEDDVAKYFLGTDEGSIGLFQNNTQLGMAVSHPITNSAKAEIGDKNKYSHIAGVFDGKKIYVYINGELKSTQEHAGEPENIKEITIGSVNNSKWEGVVDDLRIYNRVLTAEEIALLAKY